MPLELERVSESSWGPVWTRHQHAARYQWVADFAPGREVIDAACGAGYGLPLLLDRGARRVDGFDLAADAVSQANELHSRDGLRFQVADVLHLPVADESYDLFVSLETIEHIVDDRAFVAEAWRVLRPGGTLVCSTPNRRVTNPGITLAGRPYNRFHVREYTADELGAILRPPFTDVSFFGQSFYGRRYSALLGLVARAGNMLAVRLHQVRKVLGVPWEHLSRHRPRPLSRSAEPEVLIAMCVK